MSYLAHLELPVRMKIWSRSEHKFVTISTTTRVKYLFGARFHYSQNIYFHIHCLRLIELVLVFSCTVTSFNVCYTLQIHAEFPIHFKLAKNMQAKLLVMGKKQNIFTRNHSPNDVNSVVLCACLYAYCFQQFFFSSRCFCFGLRYFFWKKVIYITNVRFFDLCHTVLY